jgi:hypothetical protein
LGAIASAKAAEGDDNRSPKAQISDGEAAVMFTHALSRLRQGYGEPGDNAFHQSIVTS